MSQFRTLVENSLANTGLGARECLGNPQVLNDFIRKVVLAIKTPCLYGADESSAIYSIDCGKSFVMMSSGHCDLGRDALDISTFDFEYEVESCLDSIAEGRDED